MKPEDRLEIERLGGLAGIGLPGSRIRSRALIEGSDLSAEERDSIATLFKGGTGSVRAMRKGADSFRYRVTVHGGEGRREIEVEEEHLLESLRARLQDELI